MRVALMLLGPVSGATPEGLNPVFAFIVGGLAIIAVWVSFFRSEEAKRPTLSAAFFVSAIGAIIIALGVWGLTSPH
jgi:hypothetical protein